MEDIIQEALSKGVAMHTSGEFDLASRLYESVLKLQPDHADANHNIGLLKLESGEDVAALSHLQTALQADTSIAEFWLSYTKALIKLQRLDEAARVLDLARESGFDKEEFLELRQLLNTRSESTLVSENGREASGPSEEKLDHLMNLYNQDQFMKAIEQAQEIIKHHPQAFMAWSILGAAKQGLGILAEASRAFKKVTELNPSYPDGFNNLGVALEGEGKLEEAIKAYNQAIALNPDYAEAYYNMGNALECQLNIKKAIEAYQKAVFIKPDYCDAHFNMGLTFKAQGKLENAIDAYKKVISIKPNYPEAYNNMGLILREQGKLIKAIDNYNTAISIKPDFADAYVNKGLALQDTGNLENAIDAYKKAIAIEPNYAGAYNNMGNTFKDQGKTDEAIEAYNKALAIKPDYAEAYLNLGNSLEDKGKQKEAIESYRIAISIKNNYAQAFKYLGNTFQAQGNKEEAIKAYNKAISIDPMYAAAYRSLSSLVRYKPDHPQIKTIADIIELDDLSENQRCQFHYAFAKIMEDLGNVESAFEHYVAGGSIRKKLLSYDLSQDTRIFDEIKKTATKFKGLRLNLDVSTSKLIPIFILGMPRSGTSLIEQIISSHSKVHGAGELNFLDRFGGKICRDKGILDSVSVLQVRHLYLNALEKVSRGSLFVTDKMPQNFLYIGLILKALPEAIIVHVKRDPAATCWSNFKHYFGSDGLGYSYDLTDTTSYYLMYQNIMAFWENEYAGKINHVDYDKLTVDQEIETRKLINYLNLDWEEACLSPHENTRSVMTASQQQIRKHVYQGSSEAWRKFEPCINAIFEKLYA